jgi:hypothetical protein
MRIFYNKVGVLLDNGFENQETRIITLKDQLQRSNRGKVAGNVCPIEYRCSVMIEENKGRG